MKTRIQLGAIFVLIILVLALILSQNANPDSPQLFGLKRVQEKTFLYFKTSSRDKVDYLSSLLDVRLNEFENIIKNKSYSYMWSSSIRHSTFAGQITDIIVRNNLQDKANEIRKQFEDHKKRLDILYVAYPKNTDNVEWKYILDAINYLNAYLDKLSNLNK